jgi:hypothetical protein
VIQQVQLGQGIRGRVPCQTGALDEAAHPGLIQIAKPQSTGHLVPAQRLAVTVQDEILELLRAQLPVFIGHAHVGAAVSKIRGVPAFKAHMDAGLAGQILRLDVGV